MKLSVAQTEEIERFIANSTGQTEVIKRANAIRALGSSEKQNDVAKRFSVSVVTLRKWKKRYLEGGISGLADKPREPRKLDAKTVLKIIKLTHRTPPAGTHHWDAKQIAELTHLSPQSIRSVWREYEIDPKLLGELQRQTKNQRNPQKKEKTSSKESPHPPPNVNIKTVAQLSGFSIATVSKALNGTPGIALSTRNKIHEAATEAGYQPNIHSKNLLTFRKSSTTQPHRGNIAFLVGHPNHNPLKGLPNPEAQAIAKATKEQAEKKGYSLTTYWIHDPQFSRDRLEKTLMSQGIKGLILHQMHKSEINLSWEKYSCCYILPWKNGGPITFPSLQLDEYTLIIKACEKLSALGYFRPALAFPEIWGVEDSPDHKLSESIVHSYQQQTFIPTYKQHHFKDKKDLFLKWYFNYQPDAILSRNHIYSRRFLQWLKDAKIKVPDQCTIIQWSDFFQTQFPGYIYTPQSLAKLGLELLIEQLTNNKQGDDPEPKTVTPCPLWNPGKISL